MGFFNSRKSLNSSIGSSVGSSVNNSISSIGSSISNGISSSLGSINKSISSSLDNRSKSITRITETSAAQAARMDRKENIRSNDGEIATISALRVLYYQMSADGQITEEEKETFQQMAEELNPANAEHIDAIIKGSRMLVENNIGKPDFCEILCGGVEHVISSSIPTADSFITPKLLIWDMLAIAFSDGNYDEAEKKLIGFTADLLKMDQDTFLELESSMETLNDLEQEIKWIKTTNRPYLTIEAMVNELADRKNVIFESVKDLITL